MDHTEINVGERYGYRQNTRRSTPLVRVEILSKARPGKWKVRFVDDPALTDVVKSNQLIVSWKDAQAFMQDEERRRHLIVREAFMKSLVENEQIKKVMDGWVRKHSRNPNKFALISFDVRRAARLGRSRHPANQFASCSCAPSYVLRFQ